VALVIPVFDTSSFTEELTLDDANYRFRLDWNYRGQFWQLSIYDRDLALLVGGIKVVINYPLLDPYKYLPIPQGELFAIDTSEPNQRIEDGDLGTRVNLVYLTEDEYAAI
jgi:hypothetical protein